MVWTLSLTIFKKVHRIDTEQKKIIIQKDTSLAYFLPKTFTSLWETYPLTNFDQSRPYVRFVKKCDTHTNLPTKKKT